MQALQVLRSELPIISSVEMARRFGFHASNRRDSRRPARQNVASCNTPSPLARHGNCIADVDSVNTQDLHPW
jgi:hypothetical protein